MKRHSVLNLKDHMSEWEHHEWSDWESWELRPHLYASVLTVRRDTIEQKVRGFTSTRMVCEFDGTANRLVIKAADILKRHERFSSRA